MNTRFGRFLQGRFFPKLFLFLHAASAAFLAFENGRAAGCLLGAGAQWIVTALFAALGAVTVAYSLAGKRRFGGQWFQRSIGFVLCFIIYDLMLLAAWLACAALFQLSARAESAGTACAALIAAAVVAAGYRHARSIRRASYSIRLGEGGVRCRIAFISDVHLGAFVREAHVRRIVAQINAIEPDVVLIGGDIVDTDNQILGDAAALDAIAGALCGIRSREGVFAVLGNHDSSADSEPLRAFLEKSHIRLLDDESVHLSNFTLVGRTNGASNDRAPAESFAIDRSAPVVVLDHDPYGIPEAAEMGASLVLCGHTHKGQFFPATIFTRWANGRRFFYGRESFGRTEAVLSSGAGFFQLPVRIGTDSEVVEIRLEG